MVSYSVELSSISNSASLSFLKRLDKAITAGNQTKWSDNGMILLDPINPERLEALRMAEDLGDGLGTLPSRVWEKLQEAGLVWYLQE
jgi:hypothetical protein